MAGRSTFLGYDSVPEGYAADSAQTYRHLCIPEGCPAAVCGVAAESAESAERLEQLRLLEEGISIHVVHTPFDTIGVDTEEDLLAVERILRERAG